ncbi:uncharacterized protein LOC142345300 [Convolutriloba macropyga]|uniref:uncharacterized protein LOC142345300 n=1 Tax=Convolutriloba macropyga TaxID=536237 RepID=UPI003F51DE42
MILVCIRHWVILVFCLQPSGQTGPQVVNWLPLKTDVDAMSTLPNAVIPHVDLCTKDQNSCYKTLNRFCFATRRSTVQVLRSNCGRIYRSFNWIWRSKN